MNLDQLRAKGGIVESGQVKQSVEWTHVDEAGETVTDKFDIFVKRLSYGVMEDALSAATPGQKRSLTAGLISAAVGFGEDGQEALSYDEALQLHPGLAKALSEAVREVNGTVGKASRPPMNSGTSSSSPASAGEP
ncbi:Phage tail assembly chaperone, TAC [compost metagenome]